MSLAQVFAKNLQALRSRKHLTQQDLATRAGISVAYVSMLERGQRSPPLDTIDAIARSLKVPAVAMLDKRAGKQ